jgi:transcription-repair coupling factor (superfamily II helicase)
MAIQTPRPTSVSGLTSVRSISRWQHLLGLSQLHQLRGRVGRGSLQAYAYLMHPGLEQGSKALNRLNVMQEENALGSGFAISRRDLQLRGAGSLFGEAQKGSSSRASVEVSQYQEVVQRVAAAPDAIAAAASFANEAEATGVTNATSHWEAPTLSGSDEDAMSSDVPCV